MAHDLLSVHSQLFSETTIKLLKNDGIMVLSASVLLLLVTLMEHKFKSTQTILH